MIRELQWKDFDEVVDNYYSYYDELKDNPELGLLFRPEKPDMQNEISWFSNLYAMILRGDAIALVAEMDGKVVGICDVNRVRPDSEIGHQGVLGIAIRKEYRSRGIGKQLVSTMIEECKGKFELILLGVFTVNKNAISLYKKFGFKEYGTLPYASKRGNRYFDEMKMYLKL